MSLPQLHPASLDASLGTLFHVASEAQAGAAERTEGALRTAEGCGTPGSCQRLQ